MCNVTKSYPTDSCYFVQPVQTSEHMGALGVFGLCQIVSFITYLRSKLSSAHFDILWQTMLYIVGAILAVGIGVLTLSGNSSTKLDLKMKCSFKAILSLIFSNGLVATLQICSVG